MGIDGFFVIDKPYGPTSHQVDSWVRDILNEKKVGHVGTLDPNATGVLVMAIGKAVKLIDIVHEMPKEYVATMRFHSDVPEETIRSRMKEFVGEIYQIPPIRSAVARSLRIRRIYSIDNIEVAGRVVLFRVKCESGTYIRSLCTDLGYACGTTGQMLDLRRTKTGHFTEEQVITLQDLADYFYLSRNGRPELLNKHFISMETFFSKYPKIVVKSSAIENISHGSDLFPGGIKAITGNPVKGDRVCVIDENNSVVATGIMLVNASEIDVLKVVDFDRILIDPIASRKDAVELEPKGDVVRPRKRSQEISVQRSKGKLPKDIRRTQEGRDSRDRYQGNERPPRSERDAFKFRPGKNKRRPYRGPSSR